MSLALGIQKEKGDRSGEAAMLSQMAQASLLFGEQANAIEYLQQCLELRLALNDKRGQADTLLKIVYAHTAGKDNQRAQEAYEECVKLRQEIGDEDGIADMCNVQVEP
jgi:hypothetical protein